jgi:hypothetical protein
MGIRSDTTIEEDLNGYGLLYLKNDFFGHEIYYHDSDTKKGPLLNIKNDSTLIDLYLLTKYIKENVVITKKRKLNFLGTMIDNEYTGFKDEFYGKVLQQGSFQLQFRDGQTGHDNHFYLMYNDKTIIDGFDFTWFHGLMNSILNDEKSIELTKNFQKLEKQTVLEYIGNTIFNSKFDSKNNIVDYIKIFEDKKIISKNDYKDLFLLLNNTKNHKIQYEKYNKETERFRSLPVIKNNIEIKKKTRTRSKYNNASTKYTIYFNKKSIFTLDGKIIQSDFKNIEELPLFRKYAEQIKSKDEKLIKEKTKSILINSEPELS